MFAAVGAVVSAAPVAAQDNAPFADTPTDAYYTVPVSALAADGVFAGTECDEGFCPREPIDRKTMAVWVVRVLDGADPPAISQSRFDDVDADSFHAPFIERMHRLGVTSGCGDGSGFCPSQETTRAQMAVFLSRAFELPDGADPGFADVPADAWYAAHVAKLAASGVTQGCGDGSGFCPQDDVTRAQMATFLWRGQNLDTPQQAPGQFTAVSVGDMNVCAISIDGTIVCWNLDTSDPADCDQQRFPATCAQLLRRGAVLDAPRGQFTAVSVGSGHACAIKADRTAVCWGDNTDGQLEVPDGHYIAIDVDYFARGCALRTDQTVACWGRDGAELTEKINRQGRFTDVAVGDENVIGVRTDGSVVEVYDFNDAVSVYETDGSLVFVDDNGNVKVYDQALGYGNKGPFAAVDTDDRSGCVLLVDGTAVCRYAASVGGRPPQGEFTAISTTFDRFCGIRTDRTLYCNSIHVSRGPRGPVPTEFAPDGQFTSVSSGGNAACGVRTDGAAVCWGYFNHGHLETASLPAGVQIALPPPWDTDEIAAAEAQMSRLVNKLRQSLGLAPLTVYPVLSNVARAWSLTMRDWDIFEHNPHYSGQYPGGWTAAGENIAFNSASGRTIMDAVQVAFDGLAASQGHYANMTSPEFNSLGVGVAVEGSSFWFTQNFAHYP